MTSKDGRDLYAEKHSASKSTDVDTHETGTPTGADLYNRMHPNRKESE